MNETITPVRRSVTVAATPERTFQMFTAHFDAWWPRGHHIGQAELDHVVLDPQVGGRWYEVSVDGSTCEWGSVIAWEPPSRLLLAWHLNGMWQYDPDPTRASEVEVTFTAADGGTEVVLEHRLIERMVEGESARGALDGDGGWPAIIAGFGRLVDAGAR